MSHRLQTIDPALLTLGYCPWAIDPIIAAMPANLIKDNLRAIRNWRVWFHLGMADIRNRFARSFVGPLWIVLNLGLWVGGIGVIYAALYRQEIHQYLPFLTIGFVIWNFLTQTITDGGNAFVFAEGYIKQFTYPKQIYVLRVLVNSVVPLMIGTVIFFIVTLLLANPMGWGVFWAIPGFVMVLIAAYLHASIMAYASVRFRDLPHGMTSLLQVLFFVTPIMFPVSILKERGLDFIYQLNPLYYLIEVAREPMINLRPASTEVYAITAAYLIFLFIVTIAVAKRFDKRVVYML